MKMNFNSIVIERDDYDFNSYTIDESNKYFWRAFLVYDKFLFLSKRKKLRLAKELAIENIMNVRNNLVHSNWVCLSNDESNKEIVRKFFDQVISDTDKIVKSYRK